MTRWHETRSIILRSGADVLKIGFIVKGVLEDLKSPASAILDIDRKVSAALRNDVMPIENFAAFTGGGQLLWGADRADRNVWSAAA